MGGVLSTILPEYRALLLGYQPKYDPYYITTLEKSDINLYSNVEGIVFRVGPAPGPFGCTLLQHVCTYPAATPSRSMPACLPAPQSMPA